MFNKEQKIKFIKENYKSASSVENCLSIFNACESFEEEWGNDLCTMDEDHIKLVLDKISGVRSNSRYIRTIIVKEYVKWCIINDIPGANDCIFKVQASGISKIRETMVSSPIHLQKCLDEIFDAESEETIDNTYRCYYWLAFSGLQESDIYKIKKSDVDFGNFEIHFSGKDYPIYRESLASLKNSATLNSFVYKHPLYSNVISRDRVPGSELMRGVKAAASWQTVRAILSKKIKLKYESKETEVRISYHRVWMSGVFYRIYELERAGIPVNFSAVADDFMDGNEYKLDSGRNTIEAKKRQIMRDFKNDYDRWKVAYSIF